MTTDSAGAPGDAPEQQPTGQPAAETKPETGQPDPAAELVKWKELARKNEAKAKANAQAATELAALKASQMTDTERAVEAARAEATVEATRALGARLVAAEVRVAAAGRTVDVDTLLEGIDASKFIDDAGEPNTPAIKAWVEKVTPSAPTTDAPLSMPDLLQGVRNGTAAASPTEEFTKFVRTQLGT